VTLSQFPPHSSLTSAADKVQIDWRHMFMRQDDLLALTLSRGTDAMPMTVLGNNMMRAYRTVFDVDSQTITFATPNVCSKRVHRPLPAMDDHCGRHCWRCCGDLGVRRGRVPLSSPSPCASGVVARRRGARRRSRRRHLALPPRVDCR
jgi:hypothetical protein